MVSNKLQPIQTDNKNLILNIYRTKQNLFTTFHDSVAYVDKDKIIFKGKYNRSIIIGSTEVNSLKIASDKTLLVCSNHGLLVYDMQYGVLVDEHFIDEKIIYCYVNKFISLITETKIIVLDLNYNFIKTKDLNLYNFYGDAYTDLLFFTDNYIYYYNENLENYRRIYNIFDSIEAVEVYDIEVIVIKGTYIGTDGLYIFNTEDVAVAQLIVDKVFNFSTELINIVTTENILIPFADELNKSPEFNNNDFGFVSFSSGPELINTSGNDNLWLVTQEGTQVVIKKYLK